MMRDQTKIKIIPKIIKANLLHRVNKTDHLNSMKHHSNNIKVNLKETIPWLKQIIIINKEIDKELMTAIKAKIWKTLKEQLINLTNTRVD